MSENENSLIDELISSYENNNNRDEWLAREERRVELFKQLKPSAHRKIIESIRKEILDDQGSPIEIVNDLLVFTDIDIDDLLVFWYEETESPMEGYLFRGAGVRTEKLLLETINKFPENLDSAIELYAWCKSNDAFNHFVEWKTKPPKGSKSLLAPFDYYTTLAGWELNEHNQKRLLFSPVCHALDIALFETDPSTIAKCLLCDRPMLRLQLVPNVIADVIPDASEETIHLPFCNLCCRFDLGSMSVLKDGMMEIDTENIYKDTVPDWIKEDDILCGDLILKTNAQPRDPYFAASPWCKYRHSQLGGFPTWIQDPEFLECPTCTRRMFFFMQFQEEEVFPDQRDATFHFFFCTQCKDRFYVNQQFT